MKNITLSADASLPSEPPYRGGCHLRMMRAKEVD